MARVIQSKTNFSAGEIARDLLGRGDLRAYEGGALALRNLFIHPTGGVSRRAGTLYRATLDGAVRLIPYEYSATQTYLLAVGDGRIDVFDAGEWITTLTSPWSGAQLAQLAWTQSVEALLVVHPDVSPRKITRNALGAWSVSTWSFATNDTGTLIRQPYHKFVDAPVTLTASGGSGTVTLTASTPIFDSSWIGVRIQINGGQCTITGYTNPAVVSALVSGAISASSPTTNWAEAAFSTLRGWPVSVAFHQNRLVIGGSRDLPNRLWLSRTGNLFNFDPGTGLDDEAMEFALLSDQANSIRSVFSGRHLQVFSSGGEWMVSGDPLTPASLQVSRQTRIGSLVERNLPPVEVDGATLFAARNGHEIREFLYTDLEQAYQASDLALLSRHIIEDPVDQDFDKARRLLFLVRGDGLFATLTMYRAEQVAAWTLHETGGAVRQVCVAGESVFLVVERTGGFFLEELSDDVLLDSALVIESETPQTVWTGLDHLNGESVMPIADGEILPARVVSAGAVTLSSAASLLVVGLPYTHWIEPLPPNPASEAGAARALRPVRVILKVEGTQSVRLDVGEGMQTVTLPAFSPPEAGYSGDLEIRARGWFRENVPPLWQIESDVPLRFKLLSVTTELNLS